MVRVFYVHWHEREAADHAAALRAAGHEVHVHWKAGTPPRVPDPPPDVLVVSLDRLPSHGREVAAWFKRVSKLRAIPVIFAGGSAEKAAGVRERFPDAGFCPPEDLAAVLEKAAFSRPA